MHYYQKNIADYRKDTGHLSLLEHGIYNQVMDTYYLDEKPIETQSVIRRLAIKTDEEKLALENVLNDFFIQSECGNFWSHKRIDEEISKYHSKVETAKANGSKGGRPKKPKKTQSVNLANPEKTGSKANHKPITNNHKPLTNKSITAISDDNAAEYFATAEKIACLVGKRFPNQKADLGEWGDAIRKIVEIDKVSTDELLELWEWISVHEGNGNFSWADQIRTPMKLRKTDSQGLRYFDKLKHQMLMERNHEKHPRTSTGSNKPIDSHSNFITPKFEENIERRFGNVFG